MKKEQLLEILDRHIDLFINGIANELEDSHDHWFDNFGFPIFGETSKQYHEHVYFQSYLESYTRNMINGILKEMFEEDVADEISWPECESLEINKGCTNSECEQEFGFEFIDRDTKIGYRYSYFKADEIESLLKKGNVDGIRLVLWENEDSFIGFHYGDEPVKGLLLWDMFQEMFYDLGTEELRTMYDLFTDRVSKAVEQANAMISLKTLPGFTPSYLFKTRNDTIAKLRKEVRQLTCFSINDPKYKQTEVNSITLINQYKLSQLFLGKEYEYAFVGTSDYAKSFLTSEYLHRFFKDNPMFDYTPIVSGYLKSIEQLLHILYASYLKTNHIQKDISDYTLGSYITDIQRERIFRKELVPAKRFIIACLISYKNESRNNLFHKDYFNSWARVEQIRTNTLFLYVVLLSAVDQSIIATNPTILGVLNTEYDHLFCVLDEQKDLAYTMMLNGKEYLNLSKAPRRKGLVFDENGLITNTVQFTWLGYDKYESVEISRTNMPSELWITDRFGKKKSRLWPLA